MIFFDRPLSASAIELSLIAFSVECSCPLLFIVCIDFVVVFFFFSMSSCASDAEITSVFSRPVTAPDCDNFSTKPLSKCKFDLSEKTFSLLFQNINRCKFVAVNSIPNNCNDSLILLHLNMRSLQKNFDNLYHFLSTFPTKPDVICISETKIKDKPLLNISIPGYTFLHSSTNAGGVGIYIIDTLQYEEITLQTEFFGCENLWVRIKATVSSIHYIIGTIYRHPTSNMKDFSDYLNNSISELNDTKSYYFIIGDININTSSQSNNIVTNYLNMLDSNSVASLTNNPTRVTNTSSSTLDHILTNENRLRISPFVLNHVITDHYPVMVTVSQNVTKCKTQPKFKRSLANFSADNFNADLHESLENFSETVLSIDENNVISVFEQFYSLVQTTIDKHAPLKQLSRKQKKTTEQTLDLQRFFKIY